jgi:HD superfamily phosphodiesterase
MQIERIIPLARELLALPLDETHRDLWLWEHSERVMRLTQLVASLPELAGRSPDPLALAAAALFHDTGWVLDFQQGRVTRWQILARPTNDLQRELAAETLQEQVGHLLPTATAKAAADAIRQCNDRNAKLAEAVILAEAEALDEVGCVYAFRQFRQYQAEGRPTQQIVDTWKRQQEYRYWEVRLSTGFRFASTRAVARRRVAGVDAFMAHLGTELHGDDLAEVVRGRDDGPAAAPAK